MAGDNNPPVPASGMRCVLDREYRFVTADPQFSKFFGWPLASLQSQPVADWFHPQERAQVLAELATVGGDLGAVHIECRIRQPGDTYRWLSWTAWANFENGTLHARVSDISEAKAAHEHAMACEQYLLRYLPEVVYRMKNPFSVILGVIDFLSARDFHDKKARKLVEVQRGSAERIADLLGELRDDLSAFRPAKNHIVVNLDQLITQTVATAEPLYRKQDVTFEHRVASDLPGMIRASDHLGVALRWLTETWVMPRGAHASRKGVVTFETSISDDRLVFQVTGVDLQNAFGMWVASRRRVLETFAQGVGGEVRLDEQAVNRQSLKLEIELVLLDKATLARLRSSGPSSARRPTP